MLDAGGDSVGTVFGAASRETAGELQIMSRIRRIALAHIAVN
jgi:hypothetical protein